MKNNIEIYMPKDNIYKKLKFWCSGYGDLYYPGGNPITEDDLPDPLKYAYKEFWSEDSGLRECLVDYKGSYYLAIEVEYDPNDKNFLEEYTRAIVEISELLVQNDSCKVILDIANNKLLNNVIYFLIPAEMEKKEFDKLKR